MCAFLSCGAPHDPICCMPLNLEQPPSANGRTTGGPPLRDSWTDPIRQGPPLHQVAQLAHVCECSLSHPAHAPSQLSPSARRLRASETEQWLGSFALRGRELEDKGLKESPMPWGRAPSPSILSVVQHIGLLSLRLISEPLHVVTRRISRPAADLLLLCGR